MKLIFEVNGLDLIINNELIQNIEQCAFKMYPNEFGGFLLGRYSNGHKTVEVLDTIFPTNYMASPRSFLRNTEGIEDVLEKKYHSDKIFYIGEWHSHINGPSSYSSTDLKAMIQITECETVKIKNPILLIVSIDNLKQFEFSFYYHKNKELFRYEKKH